MCLLAFAYNHNSDAPLIVISNRDEFYQRATLPMHWWPESRILAGRDQQAGGTWLGLSKNGRFAAVTNFRDLHRNGAPTDSLRSRGDLVTEFLCASENIHDWTDSLDETCLEYGPFNLVIYDGQDMVYVNNQGDPKQTLTSGVYALSNHQLDSHWPKVDHARDQLDKAISNNIVGDHSLPALLMALSLEKTYAFHLLPNTGIPADWEETLSSPFIVSEGYGTRAATALIVSAKGKVSVAEQGYENGQKLGLNQFSYYISDD
tara:strand:- start:98 stop:880 length:783 start_codon:yes stop_codon:yes gene_type:complete